jgi:hypothetical protein
MANKDKGGRSTKKVGKSLKEKRLAKKNKGSTDSNSVDKTFGH